MGYWHPSMVQDYERSPGDGAHEGGSETRTRPPLCRPGPRRWTGALDQLPDQERAV